MMELYGPSDSAASSGRQVRPALTRGDAKYRIERALQAAYRGKPLASGLRERAEERCCGNPRTSVAALWAVRPNSRLKE